MLFIDPFFLLVFLPATLFVFWFISKRFGPTAGLCVSLLASVLFYAEYGLFFTAILTISVAINCVVGLTLASSADLPQRVRVLLLSVGQAFNFGNLIYFKYLGHLFASGEDGALQSGGVVDLAIPVGISFYTFHQAVFLVDAYARRPEVVDFIAYEGNLKGLGRAIIRYCAFILFFPQLVIGPIVYWAEFAKSTMRTTFGRFRRIDVEVGLTLLVIGLFKKVVIADQLALVADPVFQTAYAGGVNSPLSAWLGTLAYYFQLYFDFSGYSDMATGLARMFGVRFPANFDSPLRATGIVDFYRRWHITLTRVIMRFLFTPLSAYGIRLALDIRLGELPRKVVSLWIPLVLNFQIIGLWHGISSTFIFFGLVHGIWFILESEITRTRWWRVRKAGFSPKRATLLGQILTFLPLMLTFALFASANIDSFLRLLESLFLFPSVEETMTAGKFRSALLKLGVAAAIIWFLPNSNELLRAYRPAIRTYKNMSTTPIWFRFSWRPTAAWAILLICMFAASIWFHQAQAPFLYQGF